MYGVVVEVRGRKWDGRNRVRRRKREREYERGCEGWSTTLDHGR